MPRRTVRARGRVPAALVAVLLTGLALPLPESCRGDDNPAAAPAAGGTAVVLKPRYTRGEYRHAVIPWRGVRVERVSDTRGGDPTWIGATEVGQMRFSRVPLALSVPVAEFAKESFDVLFPASAAGDAPARVALAIERFELDCQHGMLGPHDATFRARMAVTVLADSGETMAGWLEASEALPGGTSKAAQERLMYQGMVGMAQGFARLGLAQGGAGGVAAPAVDPSAGRQTVTSQYQDALTMNTEHWTGVYYAYYGLTGEEMKDSYERLHGVVFRDITWWKGQRPGIGGEAGFLWGSGHAKVLDPSWTVTQRDLSMWAIPLTLTGYCKLLDPKRTAPVVPYVGLGIGAFVGVDNLRIAATTDGDEIEGYHRAVRAAWEGHALAGVNVRVSENTGLVLEAQWTQGGRAWVGSGVDENNAEEVSNWDTMHSILQRTDLSLTGWRILAGVSWGE